LITANCGEQLQGYPRQRRVIRARVTTAEIDIRASAAFDAKAGAAQHRFNAGTVRDPPIGGVTCKSTLDELHTRCARLVEYRCFVEWIIIGNICNGRTAA